MPLPVLGFPMTCFSNPWENHVSSQHSSITLGMNTLLLVGWSAHYRERCCHSSGPRQMIYLRVADRHVWTEVGPVKAVDMQEVLMEWGTDSPTAVLLWATEEACQERGIYWDTCSNCAECSMWVSRSPAQRTSIRSFMVRRRNKKAVSSAFINPRCIISPTHCKSSEYRKPDPGNLSLALEVHVIKCIVF